MRHRAVVVAVALAAATVPACGSDEGETSGAKLEWEKPAELYAPKTLPKDRILFGRIRNASSETITLKSTEVRLTTVDGKRVEGDGRFVESFVHGNVPVDIQPGPEQPEPSRLRLGYEAQIEPGESVPLTIAWRTGRDIADPVVVAFGDGTRLEIPRGPPKRI
jgi:hypothetical protein